MRTIQMTLDNDLVEAMDKIAKYYNISRSALTRNALRKTIKNINLKELEKKHKKGYINHPANKDEFSAWKKEQAAPFISTTRTSLSTGNKKTGKTFCYTDKNKNIKIFKNKEDMFKELDI